MDIQATVANGVTIIGGFAALGALFDNVFTSEQTRVRISLFLKRQSGQFEDSFFAYLAIINEAIFKRFFSAPFISLRYFTTCAILSLSSLLVIASLQIIFFGADDLAAIDFTQRQIFVFFACLVTNIVIDWISIAQTQLFFEISETQTRISHAMVLIASDLILTINFFTLLYAQPLAYGLIAYGALPDYIQWKASITSTKLELDENTRPTFEISKFLPDNQPIYYTTYRIELPEQPGEPPATTRLTITSNTEAFTIKDVFQVASSALKANLKIESQYFEISADNDDVDAKPEKKLYDQRGTENWKKLEGTDNAEEFNTGTITVPAFSIDWWGYRRYAYTASYKEIDEMQDGFPSSALSQPTFLSVGRLMSEYLALAGTQTNKIFGCGITQGNEIHWEARADITNCEWKLLLHPAQFFMLLGTIKNRHLTALVPLNSLFSTSLSMTALVYIAAIFLFMARQVFQRAIRGVASIEHWFLKSPLALMGLLLGVLIFIFTALF